MAENSAISWTRHTWNPWMGCAKVSHACDGCYAEALMDKRYGKVSWGAPGQGAGTRVRTGQHTWHDPYRWARQARKDGDRPFVFCASLADIFDNQVDPQWRVDAFDVMRETPELVYLLLTKRPQLIVRLAEAAGGLPSNAAIGATCEDQPRLDRNEAALVEAAAEVEPLFTFLSCEPLLGPLRFRHLYPIGDGDIVTTPRIDWVITGGETDQGGHKARPSNPQWFRDIRDQCAAAGVPFHHKQNGEWVSVSEVEGPGDIFTFEGSAIDDHNGRSVRRVGKRRSGRTIDGATHDAFPAVR